MVRRFYALEDVDRTSVLHSLNSRNKPLVVKIKAAPTHCQISSRGKNCSQLWTSDPESVSWQIHSGGCHPFLWQQLPATLSPELFAPALLCFQSGHASMCWLAALQRSEPTQWASLSSETPASAEWYRVNTHLGDLGFYQWGSVKPPSCLCSFRCEMLCLWCLSFPLLLSDNFMLFCLTFSMLNLLF